MQFPNFIIHMHVLVYNDSMSTGFVMMKQIKRGANSMALKLNTSYNEMAKSWEVELIGEIDINSKAILKEELVQLNEKKQSDFVFKCDNLDYIDSTGLGVLISFYKNVRINNNTIHFEKLKPSIQKIFTLTGLDRIFSIRN